MVLILSQICITSKNTVFIIRRIPAGEVENASSQALSFRISSVQRLLLYTLPFNISHKKKTHAFRSGERGVQNPLLIFLSPQTQRTDLLALLGINFVTFFLSNHMSCLRSVSVWNVTYSSKPFQVFANCFLIWNKTVTLLFVRTYDTTPCSTVFGLCSIQNYKLLHSDPHVDCK